MYAVWCFLEVWCLVWDRITTISCHFQGPFVKRFTLCHRTVVCLSCLSATLVYCGQTVG